MCWQSTILNKQIATEDIPVVKVCELYYPFAVLYSGGAVFYKSPYHSFVYSFSPAEKVNLIVNTHKGSKEFLSGKTYYTIEAGYHCYNPEVDILFDGKDRLYDGKFHFLVRGWGYLTGCGGLNLPKDLAAKMQDGFIEYILDRLNGK